MKAVQPLNMNKYKLIWILRTLAHELKYLLLTLLFIWAFVAMVSPALGDEFNGWNLNLVKANGDVDVIQYSVGGNALFPSKRSCANVGYEILLKDDKYDGFICKPHFIKTVDSNQKLN
jgi:hypothetical protein